MDEHTRQVLEFGKVRQKLAGLCQSPLGQGEISGLNPTDEQAFIRESLEQIQQMKEIFLYQGGFPSLAVKDLREVLARIKPEGISLNPAELLDLGEVLVCVREILKFAKEIKGKFSLIEKFCARLTLPEKLLSAIQKSIEPNGDIKDSASPQLAKIRRGLIEGRQELVAKLHSILRSAKVKPEEEIVTSRQGRFVISLPETDLSKVKGMILDRSGTGMTYFVEPVVAVEQNNRLKELELDERQEIHRILLSLTQLVRENLEPLETNLVILGKLDALAAKARLAVEWKCNSPLLNKEEFISLRKARHPFLDKEKVIPLTIELGKDFCTLVITGPNTGGKTVALKTVGLLSLMLQTGLQIPAEADSSVGIFKNIFADIGDEQSIEMSLSTFSAHFSHIARAMQGAGRESLILLDEIGAGTDPQEGAALAEAILLYLTQCEAKTIVSTHLGALKVLAQNNPKIKNGSFEFDSANLKPTYQFRPGLPGSSYAVEIASRLGLKPEIINRAKSLIGTQEKDLTSLLTQLDLELKQIREERTTLSRKTEQVEETLRHYTEKMGRIEAEQKDIKKKALTEAKELLAKSRIEIEHLIKELRETKAEKESIKKALSYVSEQSQEIEMRINESQPAKLVKLDKIKLGERVWVETLRAEGEISALPDRSGKVKVQVRGVTVTVPQTALFKSTATEKIKTGQTRYKTGEDSVPLSLSVRGMTADEAVEEVDKYLDRAFLAGLSEVSIIHGKGGGTLRKKITQFLKEHKRVEETRLAEWDQGGLGVTLAKLKK